MQHVYYIIPGQECPSTSIKIQVEMDAQIAHRLHTEEQAMKQYHNFQTVEQVGVDCIDHSAQALHRENRQYTALGQVRSNICLGYNQAEKGSENN